MKNIRSKMIIIGIAFLLCSCSKPEYKKVEKIDIKNDIDDVMMIETSGDDVCAVTSYEEAYSISSAIMGTDYVMFRNAQGRAYRNRRHTKKTELDEYTLDLYSIKNKRIEKQYMLSDIQTYLEEQSKKDGKDYELLVDGRISIIKHGEEYSMRTLLTYDWSEENPLVTKGFLYINLGTGEMQITDNHLYGTKWNASYIDYDTDPFLGSPIDWKSGKDSLLNANGFNCNSLGDYEKDLSLKMLDASAMALHSENKFGVLEVYVSTNALPEKNEKLYQKFPELKTYRGEEGLVAILHLANYPSAEDLLNLLVEDEKGISFENCVLTSQFSKDGKEHVINSYDELRQWYITPEPKE